MSEERLQKILARAGVASRRKVEELIREGRVTVNGEVAGVGDKADLERDAVKVDGERIQPARNHCYLLLNKPRGVMSTVSDPGGRPTVIDLVPAALRKALVPVGRLDFLTEGLLLLTDDGEFAQQVAHPSHGCVKTYEVKVKGQPAEGDIDRLRAGITLAGRRTAPCRIRPRPASRRPTETENSWWVVELSEGRTRQIREMFQRIGHPVQKLRRVAIGPVSDDTMAPGDLRELTTREVEALRRKVPPRKAPPKAGARSATPGKEPGKPGKGRGAPRERRELGEPAAWTPSGRARPAERPASGRRGRPSAPRGRAAAGESVEGGRRPPRSAAPGKAPARRSPARPGPAGGAKPRSKPGTRPQTRPGTKLGGRGPGRSSGGRSSGGGTSRGGSSRGGSSGGGGRARRS